MMFNAKLIVSLLGFAAMGVCLTVPDISNDMGLISADVDELLSTQRTSSIDIMKWTSPLNVSAETAATWPDFVRTFILDEIKATLEAAMDVSSDPIPKLKRRSVFLRQSNRQRVEAEINSVLDDARNEHGESHRRQLAGCRSVRCEVCGAGLSVAWVAALGACGTAAATEEAISAGTLTPVAAATLAACVSGAHGVYAAGWAGCLGMV